MLWLKRAWYSEIIRNQIYRNFDSNKLCFAIRLHFNLSTYIYSCTFIVVQNREPYVSLASNGFFVKN